MRLRRFAAVGLAGLSLLLGGCVYLRLLALKGQLAKFDRYFETDLRDGLRLTCHEPVLLDTDMAFFGLAPEKRERTGAVERWHFRWIKDYAAPAENSPDYEVHADFYFAEHKLQRVVLPERLFAFLPKPNFLSILRAFGQAKVDRENRAASATVGGPAAGTAPTMTGAALAAMLGAAQETRSEGASTKAHYRYRPATTDQHAGRIDVVFTVGAASGNVQRIDGLLFNAQLHVELSDPAPPAPVVAGLR